MKNIFKILTGSVAVSAALVLFTTTASAAPYHHDGYRGGYHAQYVARPHHVIYRPHYVAYRPHHGGYRPYYVVRHHGYGHYGYRHHGYRHHHYYR